VVVMKSKEPGIVGAAAIAFTGLGRHPTLAAAQDAVVRVRRIHRPDASCRAAADRLFESFCAAHAAIAPLALPR
jgi:xylulokinase